MHTERPVMKIGRLQRLITILRNVKKREDALRKAGLYSRKFDMGTWAVRGEQKTIGLSKHLCDTRACALGWAATDPQFKRAGLSLFFAEGAATGIVVYQPDKSTPLCTSFTAAEKFFGLTCNEATRIFTANSGEDGVPAVIRQIERTIRDYRERT